MYAVPLVAAVIAVVLCAIVWKVARWGHPGRDFHWTRVALFLGVSWLATWAIGVWMAPIGPQLFGAPIVTMVLVALAFGILVGYTLWRDVRIPLTRDAMRDRTSAQRVSSSAFVTFFSILMVVLVLALLARYIWM